MGESVRPTRSDDITDAMIDRWEKNGDKPVLCAALIQRMRAETSEVIDRKEDKIFVPKVLLDLYEISASRHENTLDLFQEICAKHGIDPTKYLEFNQKLAKGKPVEFERMRTFIHIVLLILCEKLKIDKKVFQSEGTGGLFVVGGVMYAEAEKLAKVLYSKVSL